MRTTAADSAGPGHLASDLADSTALKLLQPLIMVILVPLVGWGGNKVLDRMDSIEKALSATVAVAATNEFRLRAMEAVNPKLETEMRAINDRMTQLQLRIELMDARKK